MENLLKDYPVIIEIPVAWGEMDALQHINNVVYFRYFESVRVEYMEKIDFLGSMADTGIGPILAATRCRYKMPLTYPDRVWAGAKVDGLEGDRFFMSYAVASEKRRRIAAVGEAEIVAFDYRNNAKTEIPGAVREKIFEIEGKSLC